MSFTEDILPDAQYDPTFQPEITRRTRLAQSITLSKFIGSYSDPNNLNHLTVEDKLLLAKQYYLHAQVMQSINSSPGLRGAKGFEKFRLIVSEGYYREGPEENLDVTDGINYLKTNGRAVVYELIGEDGEIAFDKTFDLAVYLKNNVNYDKIILNYDSYNPNGKLHVDIVLIMPEIIAPWNVTYNQIIETRFNNAVQATGEFLEIGQEESTTSAPQPLNEDKVYAVYGTSNFGTTSGQRGYFYPLYLDSSKVGEAFHKHTFTEYPEIEFWMPLSNQNHAKTSYNTNLYTLYPSNEINTSSTSSTTSSASSAGVGNY
jgi:hypothetical protein